MIHVSNLERHYPDFALNISRFDVPENTITGLVGVNGSGKTTLFRLIAGLAKADSGDVSVFNENAWDMPVSVKKRIGVVFGESGFPGYFMIEDVKKSLASWFDTFDKDEFDRLCEKMKLPSDKAIHTFSNGMQAKLKIIAAISHKPDFLLLDEPTAGLDVSARFEIHQMLQDFMETDGRAILISSHIASDLEQLCDDFWMIKDGSITMHETVDDLLTRYGVLHLSDEQMESLDDAAIVARQKTRTGWKVLVNDRRFYEENYPMLHMDKGNIDDLILITQGE